MPCRETVSYTHLDINVYKRDTQGVILMRVEEGNRVISIERVDPEQEEE